MLRTVPTCHFVTVLLLGSLKQELEAPRLMTAQLCKCFGDRMCS